MKKSKIILLAASFSLVAINCTACNNYELNYERYKEFEAEDDNNLKTFSEYTGGNYSSVMTIGTVVVHDDVLYAIVVGEGKVAFNSFVAEPLIVHATINGNKEDFTLIPDTQTLISVKGNEFIMTDVVVTVSSKIYTRCEFEEWYKLVKISKIGNNSLEVSRDCSVAFMDNYGRIKQFQQLEKGVITIPYAVTGFWLEE